MHIRPIDGTSRNSEASNRGGKEDSPSRKRLLKPFRQLDLPRSSHNGCHAIPVDHEVLAKVWGAALAYRRQEWLASTTDNAPIGGWEVQKEESQRIRTINILRGIKA